jgi:hypothetical protein
LMVVNPLSYLGFHNRRYSLQKGIVGLLSKPSVEMFV